jgi:hypothetical protein
MVLQVCEGADRPVAEWGSVAYALGFVQADRRFGERVLLGFECPRRVDQGAVMGGQLGVGAVNFSDEELNRFHMLDKFKARGVS